MGADARFSSQPVVRRALSDASVSPLASGSDQAALERKREEKQQRDADREAMDNGAFFDRLVDALEQRVLDELERRGHRHAPGVF